MKQWKLVSATKHFKKIIATYFLSIYLAIRASFLRIVSYNNSKGEKRLTFSQTTHNSDFITLFCLPIECL